MASTIRSESGFVKTFQASVAHVTGLGSLTVDGLQPV